MPDGPLEVQLRFEAVGMPAKLASEADISVDEKAIALGLDASRPLLVACYSGRPLSTTSSDGPAATWLATRVSETGEARDVRVARSNAPDESGRCAADALAKIAFGGQPRPFALSVWVEVVPKETPRAGGDPATSGVPAPTKATARSRLPEGSCASDHVLSYLPICQGGPGGLWSDESGDAFGSGGLGLSGIGEGAGKPEGMGLGGARTPNGQGFGGGGRLSGTHRSKPPQVRMGATSVSGRLPPEVIQRIVRQHFGRFRLCYEDGLRSAPELAGQVTVMFTIAEDGSVSTTSHSGSLPDGAVASCVEKAFSALSFPAPEGGTVRVTYPISFSPGDPGPKEVSAILGIELGQLVGPALATAATRGNAFATSVDWHPEADVPFVVFVDVGGEHYAVVRAPKGAPRLSSLALLGQDFNVYVIPSGAAKPTTKFLE